MKFQPENRRPLKKILLAALSCVLSFSSFQAVSDDIDIFAAAQDVTPNKPNVLIVLDNSANWSRAAQQWPPSATGSTTQGESEARALKAALLQLPANSVNVGLFEYRTEGAAGDQDGGYVASHIRPMSITNRDAFVAKLDRIAANINDPIEKRPIGNPFGTLLHDVYNYLAGVHAFGRTGDPVSGPDNNASRGDG